MIVCKIIPHVQNLVRYSRCEWLDRDWVDVLYGPLHKTSKHRHILLFANFSTDSFWRRRSNQFHIVSVIMSTFRLNFNIFRISLSLLFLLLIIVQNRRHPSTTCVDLPVQDCVCIACTFFDPFKSRFIHLM